MIIFPLNSQFSLYHNLAMIFNENGTPKLWRFRQLPSLPVTKADPVRASGEIVMSGEIVIHVPVMKHVLWRYQITCMATALPKFMFILLCADLNLFKIQVAEVIAAFLVRNRFVEPTGNFQR